MECLLFLPFQYRVAVQSKSSTNDLLPVQVPTHFIISLNEEYTETKDAATSMEYLMVARNDQCLMNPSKRDLMSWRIMGTCPVLPSPYR
jgi:hypothetical protein